MENYFYLFGFIYLLLLARKIYGYTIPVKEEDVLKIDENTTFTDLIDVKEKSDSIPKKSPIWIILDIIIFFLLVIGYVNHPFNRDKVVRF